MESINYLSISHMTGSSPLPKNYELAHDHPVCCDNGKSGVLLRNARTKIYTLFIGGTGMHMESVDQQEAERFISALQSI